MGEGADSDEGPPIPRAVALRGFEDERAVAFREAPVDAEGRRVVDEDLFHDGNDPSRSRHVEELVLGRPHLSPAQFLRVGNHPATSFDRSGTKQKAARKERCAMSAVDPLVFVVVLRLLASGTAHRLASEGETGPRNADVTGRRSSLFPARRRGCRGCLRPRCDRPRLGQKTRG